MLTGEKEKINEVVSKYRVYVNKLGGEEEINHSSIIYLIDPHGKYVTHFALDLNSDENQSDKILVGQRDWLARLSTQKISRSGYQIYVRAVALSSLQSYCSKEELIKKEADAIIDVGHNLNDFYLIIKNDLLTPSIGLDESNETSAVLVMEGRKEQPPAAS
ncbi:Thioredoxin-like fold,Copper chaperone SCO1/SenC [Cinara cedri]|uniref:Thioredoxin-like fold,Copper chaperone SCO1/SenC n=1 Tax=Cinara cedri TaxID=506608 RepID=A0A5E4N514_9HEMI|nr:Thioredoxin-like fold,Copper chaperone SCO1/SenC [Cinara cedri]